MKIKLKVQHSSAEVAASLLSLLKLFQERYEVDNFREIDLNLTLMNKEGEDVEIIDVSTSEVLDVFEVYKNSEELGDELIEDIGNNNSDETIH